MSAHQEPALTAVTFQLLARAEAYEADVTRLVAGRLDLDLYQRASGHMDEMRLYAASLPQLAAAWVEVMIRHFELTHGLWRQGQGSAEVLHGPLAQLLGAVHRLQEQCRQSLLAPSATAAALSAADLLSRRG